MLCITSNYEARKFGVKKGDHIAVAKNKCPHITICNGEDLTFYHHLSSKVPCITRPPLSGPCSCLFTLPS